MNSNPYVNTNVTIHDVARLSKTSTATVSRAINEPEKVSETTRKRIYDAIKQLKYIPNANGRRLRKTRNENIVVIMPNISNPFYADIVKAINQVAEKNQYETCICLTNLEAELELKYLNDTISGQYSGAILVGCELKDSRVIDHLQNCKAVQCCEYNAEADAPHISINNYLAAYQAVKYLVDIGHRRIGFIGSTNECVSSLKRFEGYKDCLISSGIEYEENLVLFADAAYSYSSAFQVAKRLLTMGNRPTAIFTISDTMAVAVLNAARIIGLKVPEHLSVFGCDNVDISKIMFPDISTIDQSRYMIGERAMKLLIDLLEDNYIPEREIYVEHKILVRGSTSACRNNLRRI